LTAEKPWLFWGRSCKRWDGQERAGYSRKGGRRQRINDSRKAWALACREATPELQEREGTVREKRRAELETVVARAEKPGLSRMPRHDFRRTAVRNMVNRGVP
jgi:hypothetical protein